MTAGRVFVQRLLVPCWLVLLFFGAAPSAAQVAPNLRWRTLTSTHFHVHYSPGLEESARATLSLAEKAYALLSRELKAPRGRIDIVVADNRDFANGYASIFPTNRMVLYAVPPADIPMLRASHDWRDNLITHELTHIFHLDRSEGLWRLARWVFGRNPSMMPNLYSPAWLREGLAVYYETALNESGRLASGEQQMLVLAAAEEGRLPGLGDMSLATSRPPEGHTPYVFGAHLVQALAQRAGPEKMDDFVASMSASIFPYLTSHSAKRKLGISFGEAWREYRDSVERTYASPVQPMPGWRLLTRDERTDWHPRWLNADSLLHVRSDGRSVPALFLLTRDGVSRRMERRNSLSINAPAPNGRIVFSQPEYTDPYTLRFDLYERDADGSERRLTHGARLTSVDVRADGRMVAVQAFNGSTRLVLVSASGGDIQPVTEAEQRAYWTDPRWSPDGREIVAVRRDSAGGNSLVVLDEGGRQKTLVESSAMLASPAWLDAERIVFQRDSGRSQIAVFTRASGTAADAGGVTVISSASTGVLQPEPSPPDQGGVRMLAAVEYKAAGYRIGIAPVRIERANIDQLPPINLSAALASPVGVAPPAVLPPPGSFDSIPSRRYSPWRLLIPRYWVPLAAADENDGVLLGASTSAADVIDRHFYSAELLYNTESRVFDGSLNYSYAGLGMPVLSVSLGQNSSYGSIRDEDDARLGFLREQSRFVSLSAQLSRPRFRNFFAVSAAGEYERLTFDTDPAHLIDELGNFNTAPREFVVAAAGAGWSNTRRPPLSISPEDGFTFSLSARERWRLASGRAPSLSVTGSMRAFKAIDLPGFAHHVLALRLAAGVANSHSTSRFSVGGKSGSKLELFPGYSIGDVSRSFPVRGFEPGTLAGLRAASASLEYRAPLAMPAHGFGMFPLFFDRISMSVFADAGSAWCPSRYSLHFLCDDVASSPDEDWIASAGAELNFDTALQYDIPYRMRIGIANAVRDAVGQSRRGVEFYFTLGFPF